MGKDNKPPCSDEMFVVAWEKAKTLAEAARLAGYTGPRAHKIASARACRLRERGVALTKFKTGVSSQQRVGEVDKLNYMASRARDEGGPEEAARIIAKFHALTEEAKG